MLSNLVIRSKSTEALFQEVLGKTRRFRDLCRIWQELDEFVLQAYSLPPSSKPLALILSAAHAAPVAGATQRLR
jgi:hypothetical protein